MNTKHADETIEDVIDLEQYAQQGKKVPQSAKGYRFKVNGGEPITVSTPIIKGRKVLELANLVPPENYTLRVKIAGQAPRKVGLDEDVDLRAPGTEKFKALPRDQTEGEASLARQFTLLPRDDAFLRDFGLPWETVVDGSQWVLIHEFPTHGGYDHRKVTAAVRLEVGYPHTQLDMVYFYPPLTRTDGKAIGATQATQIIQGKSYQRWSRHRTSQNPWRAGEDGLESHILLIQDWLAREFGE